jgi:alpha-glucosidase
MREHWWRGGVLYQIYVRSFADSNRDGVGDLAGVRSKLDYLEWLGVDGIWLSPVTVSPDDDFGYDVSDYCDVQPVLGDLAELDRLVADAGERGIRLLLDIVPNHSSDRHPWFVESRSSRDAPRRNWYVWADSRPDGSVPNNWVSAFGGPAWTLDEPTGQYYLHHFLPSQPDLDWWTEGVRDAFDDVLRFWFDRGVAGFRIDVAHGLVKDPELRDNPPDDQWAHNMNHPEVHEVYRRWRRIADAYDPPRIFLGETWVLDAEKLGAYYGDGDDELHMAFNFPFVLAPFETARLRPIVEETEAAIPGDGWPVWTLSNHDVPRFPTRWADGDERKIRAALLLLFALRGTPVLYYGDELGMPETDVHAEDRLDPARRHNPPGRDGARTPMHWDASAGAGFTEPEVRPWLPVGRNADANVADQRDDPGSVLSFVRELIALRRAESDLHSGAYRTLAAPDRVWAWRRGNTMAVAVNLSDEAAAVERVEGRVRFATRSERAGETIAGRLELAPWEGVVAGP